MTKQINPHQWRKRLLSGEVERCSGILRDGESRCCLGVLADMLGADVKTDRNYISHAHLPPWLSQQDQIELSMSNDVIEPDDGTWTTKKTSEGLDNKHWLTVIGYLDQYVIPKYDRLKNNA